MKNHFRFFVLAVAIAAIRGTALFAAVPVPTNLSVTQMRAANGLEYFHVTFDQIKIPTGGNAYDYSYTIVRWSGAVPDTFNRRAVTNLSHNSAVTQQSYDDYTAPTASWIPGYAIKMSYSVYTEAPNPDSSKSGNQIAYSALATPVACLLDTVNISFTQYLPKDISGQPGDTIRGTFHAVESSGNATMRYHVMMSGNQFAFSQIDSTTGAFWCVQESGASGVQYTTFLISAQDDSYRIAYDTVTLTVTSAQVSMRIQQRLAASGAPLAANTRTYYGFFPAPTADTANYRTQYFSVLCDTTGSVNILCDSGAYLLRVQPEGYAAQWVSDPNGASTLAASGTVTITLQVAPAVKIGGRVGGVRDTGIAGATISAVRTWGTSDYSGARFLDSVSTDAAGSFHMSVAQGDSLLNTNEIYVQAFATGYNGSPEWYSDNTYNIPVPIALTSDHDSINFLFSNPVATNSCTVYINVSESAISDSSRKEIITVYQLRDTSFITFETDTIFNGNYVLLPPGKYLFLAQPIDTGFLSGYYHIGGYASMWQQADTLIVVSGYLQNITIILQKDSSVTPPGGGSPIDGVVSNGNGPLGNTHLLLYKTSGAPAGTTASKKLIRTTVTNSSGNYSFTKLGVGTYAIDVDFIGGAPFEIGNIVVDSSGQEVKKNISVGASTVNENNFAAPAAIALAQNFPNPFSEQTSIAFTIASPNAAAQLSIYDITGRKIATLADQIFDRGDYVVDVHQHLMPGVYSVVLRSGENFISRMMVVGAP